MRRVLTILAITVTAAVSAQPKPQPTPATTTTSTTTPDVDQHAVRSEFVRIVAQHPDDVGHELAFDPTLLSDDTFLGRYPELAQFVAQHPEMRRNPHFYVRDLDSPRGRVQRRTTLDGALENITIVSVVLLVVFAITWLVRAFIDQRRWNELSKRQAEVHNRILDRFSSTEEVLEYIRSEAGAKFLQSAPIAVHSEPQQKGPFSRVLWSINVGIVTAFAGMGMAVVSHRVAGDASEGFFALGIIALCVGGGFLVSAFVSAIVLRRFGTWRAEDAGAVR